MIYLLIILLSPLYAFIYARANSIKLESGYIGHSFIVSFFAAATVMVVVVMASESIFNFKWVKNKQTTELYDGLSVTQQEFSKELVNKKTGVWLGSALSSENMNKKTVFIIESDSSTVIIEVENADKLNITNK